MPFSSLICSQYTLCSNCRYAKNTNTQKTKEGESNSFGVDLTGNTHNRFEPKDALPMIAINGMKNYLHCKTLPYKSTQTCDLTIGKRANCPIRIIDFAVSLGHDQDQLPTKTPDDAANPSGISENLAQLRHDQSRRWLKRHLSPAQRSITEMRF